MLKKKIYELAQDFGKLFYASDSDEDIEKGELVLFYVVLILCVFVLVMAEMK